MVSQPKYSINSCDTLLNYLFDNLFKKNNLQR